jgi:hypothetical protein
MIAMLSPVVRPSKPQPRLSAIPLASYVSCCEVNRLRSTRFTRMHTATDKRNKPVPIFLRLVGIMTPVYERSALLSHERH